MDLPSKYLYDTFKDEIWKELGPLDPDWFEALTAQTSSNEGNVCDQDDLCANQEGGFKAPFDKAAVDSQLFSTPKVFRQRRVVSPETEDEHSFTAEQEKETLPWTATQSPCLFSTSKDDVQGAKYEQSHQGLGSFDLLHTLQKSPVSYAKQISESLGAQIHPDISWTSSLNTPPPIASTLILTKTDDSPCPASVSAETNVVFVRKLFPSLSNASRVGVVSPENNAVPAAHQGVSSMDAQNPESLGSPQTDSVWRQKLPDGIEDGEIRSTAANVLDGAEDVLSIFFPNNSSALRKVKTAQIKRKQINPTKGRGCSSTDVSTTKDAAFSKQRTADQDTGLPSPPRVKTGDGGISQWFPLSLSEIPSSTVDTSSLASCAPQVENTMSAEQLKHGSDSGTLVRSHTNLTDSGFTKKRRTFVYAVQTPKLQVQGEETPSQKRDSSAATPDSGQEVTVKKSEKTPDEERSFSIGKNKMQKWGNLVEENLAKVQDLDMSQLSRDFAQDFSQMSDPSKLCKVEAETPENDFSPSACLSAMKRANQKALQAITPRHPGLQACDGAANRSSISTTAQNNLINEGNDSGFQSAAGDMTHMTLSSFVLPSLENNGQSQQRPGVKTDGTASNKRNGDAHVDVLQEADVKLSSAAKQSQTLECASAHSLSCARETVDNVNWIPPNGPVHSSRPESRAASVPSVHASGFKTASQKGIRISSANLERAKRLLEETEQETTCNDRPVTCANGIKDQLGVENTNCNSNEPLSSSDGLMDNRCQLTASQKADVTELCTLLEEADSQFEFTQFQTATLRQQCQDNAPSPQKGDKELDPYFLTGIDFDDSFSSDAEKQPALTVTHDRMVSDKTSRETPVTRQPTGPPSGGMKKENATDAPSSSSKQASDGSSVMSAETKTHDGERNKLQENPSMLGEGFKTAGGNVVRVSKACLSKARALFADLERSPVTSERAPDKRAVETCTKSKNKTGGDVRNGSALLHEEAAGKIKRSDGQVIEVGDEDALKGFKNGGMDTAKHESGFQMASGKRISISAKALQEAGAFFKDSDAVDTNTGISAQVRKSVEPLSGTVTHKENLSAFEDVHTRPAPHTGVGQHDVTAASAHASSSHGNSSSTPKALSSLSCTESKSGGSSCSLNESSNGGGFSTATGKKVSVSADAMREAESVFNDIHTDEDTKKPNQKGNTLRAAYSANQAPVSSSKNVGFQTASGKGFNISAAALKKAKSLLSEFDEVKDENNVKPTHSRAPGPGPSKRNGGFQAACGKPVAFSFEALQKAKALFSDISVSAEIPAVPNTKGSNKKQDNAEHAEKTQCGFTTAGGTKVHVSQKNLLKAKNLFSEFDDGFVSAKAMQEADAFFEDGDMDRTDGVPGQSRASVSGSGSEKRHDPKLKREQRVISEEPGCGLTEHEHVAVMLRSDDVEVPSDASLNGGPSLTVKTSLLSNTSMKSGCSPVNELSKDGGFCTANEKKESVSEDSMTKAKFVLNEIDALEDRNKHKVDLLPSNKGGFQTASGKGFTISSAALKKAKSLLSEFDEVKDENNVKPTHSRAPVPGPSKRNGGFQAARGKPVAFSSEALQKAKALFSDISVSAEIPAVPNAKGSNKKQDNAKIERVAVMLHSDDVEVPNDASLNGSPSLMAKTSPLCKTSNKQQKHKVDSLPPQTGGFQTASGKGVDISAAALKKGKTLFSECEAVEDQINVKPTHSRAPVPGPSKRNGGFQAASGKPVAFSSEALQKAKALFSDISVNAEIPAVPNTRKRDPKEGESPPQIHQSSMCLQVTDHEPEAQSAQGDISIKDEGLAETFHLKDGNITPSGVHKLHDSPGEEMSDVLDCEMNEITSNEGSQDQTAQCFASNRLSGCTEAQQMSFSQEALDCAKALLEDENRAAQNPSMASEKMPPQDDPKSSDVPAVEQKGKGKRLAADQNMTGQPPLKRRLLEEFDRTVDGPTGSALHPEKSSPNVVIKDRRVFKYSVSLHPHITGPHRTGSVETRLQKTTEHWSPADSRAGHSKMSTFVPPFIKSAKTQSDKNAASKDNIRTPSAFIPPFKKQRTVFQDSSCKPLEEGNKLPHLTPTSSNTYTPPTRKTQSATDVTSNKGKEDVQAVNLAETASDNLMNHQTFSEVSAAELLCDGTSSRSRDMLQNLHNIELARDMQDMRIRKKRRQTIRPFPGSLFLTKTSGVPRIPLKSAVNGRAPARFTQKQLYGYGVHLHVCEITGETAEAFRFSLQQFVKQEAFIDGGGVQLGDGGWLIPRNDGTAGKEEFYRSLCDTPGVDPKLISEEWAYNHYRWIVWKQSSMERSFPEVMGSVCLTPEQVLLQLKYRYDVEVDHSRRPALRKIMEKDDTAAKTLVLCVCGVSSRGHAFTDIKTPGADAKVENAFAVIWLTDGWYAIKAQLDQPLTAMLHKGRLAVGGKLIIHGAQLVGSQDACSPLEAPESLMLKICANSSRPTRWDAKLGFHKDPRPFLLPVSCLYNNGGPVGFVDVVVLRSYPIQWMERKPDGGVVFRSVRAEEKEARRHNGHKQKAMEILFAKIQDEFEKEEKSQNKPQRRRRTVGQKDVARLCGGEELYEAVGDDPAYLQAHLSDRQLETLHSYRRFLVEKKQAELQDRYRRALESAEGSDGSCPKRDVTPVWRLGISDSADQPGTVYQLNLWRPPSDLQSLLKEGCRYKVYNLTTSDGKKHGGGTAVQLTGTKKTQFQDLQVSQEWLSARFQPRVSTHFVDLQNPDFQPLCGEVDLTGYIISVIDGQGFSPAFYLTDGKLNFVKVRCFSNLAQSGLEDVVKPGVLLALSNLQLRGQSTSPTPVLYAGDLTVFSTNPKEVHLQDSLGQLRNLVQGQEKWFQTAEEKLSDLIRSGEPGWSSSPALQARTPASTRGGRQDAKTSVTSQQPVRSLGSITPVSRNLLATNSSTENDLSSRKRRRALDYLSRIPSPPPLSLLGSIASPCVKKTFIPPRRSATPCTLKTVQTPACKPVDSPVEEEWVNDEELAMIDTQALLAGD